MSKTRLTIEIDKELKKKLKVKAAQRGLTIREALEVLIKSFIIVP